MKSIKYVAEDGQWCGRKKEGEENAEGQEVSPRRQEDGRATVCYIRYIQGNHIHGIFIRGLWFFKSDPT